MVDFELNFGFCHAAVLRRVLGLWLLRSSLSSSCYVVLIFLEGSTSLCFPKWSSLVDVTITVSSIKGRGYLF